MKNRTKLKKMIKELKRDSSPKYKTILVLDFETSSITDFNSCVIEPIVAIKRVRVK